MLLFFQLLQLGLTTADHPLCIFDFGSGFTLNALSEATLPLLLSHWTRREGALQPQWPSVRHWLGCEKSTNEPPMPKWLTD